MSTYMDSDSEFDLANAHALIELWQQEENRLREIIANPETAPEVRNQSSERLTFVVSQIQEATDALAALQAGH